jgi:hypothetical protein
MITSCLECRRRKLKCNKSHPCTNCVKFARDCVFLAPALDQASQLKLTEIKEKVGSLERLLERDVAKSAAASNAAAHSQDRTLPDETEDNLPAQDDEKDLEPTPLAVVDAAYEVDGEDDDLLDLGIQMGKMRITERIGGFFRPKISQEVGCAFHDSFLLSALDSSSCGKELRFQRRYPFSCHTCLSTKAGGRTHFRATKSYAVLSGDFTVCRCSETLEELMYRRAESGSYRMEVLGYIVRLPSSCTFSTILNFRSFLVPLCPNIWIFIVRQLCRKMHWPCLLTSLDSLSLPCMTLS